MIKLLNPFKTWWLMYKICLEILKYIMDWVFSKWFRLKSLYTVNDTKIVINKRYIIMHFQSLKQEIRKLHKIQTKGYGINNEVITYFYIYLDNWISFLSKAPSIIQSVVFTLFWLLNTLYWYLVLIVLNVHENFL